MSSPVPDEQVAGLGFDESSVSTPFPAPVEDRPPSAPEEREDPESAGAVAEDWSSARDATTPDTGEWWIVDNPPVPEADPHQWWIVDDSAEAMTGAQAPAPDPEDDASGLEASHPTAGPEQEDAPRRAGRRSRDRRERDLQHGWASSLASKRNRAAGSGSGSGSGEKNVPLSHQLRAHRVWAMEETDTVVGEAEVREAEVAPPAPAQEGAGNVVRLPVENHSEAVAEDIAPEARVQENPVTAIASGGSTGPESVGSERVAPRGAASGAARPESVAAERAAPEEVAPESLSQESGPEGSRTTKQGNISPDLEDLLEMAAVQAAVDAIVDAAVRGAATGSEDDLE